MLSPSPTALSSRPDDVGHLLRERGHRERGVLRGVGDAVAAAEVDLGAVDAVLVDDPGVQADEAPGRHLEAAGVEDLAADVAVQPAQVEHVGPRQQRGGRVERLAAGQAEAELLVLVTGGDELVGVRLDADGHPHHDRGHDAELGRDGGDPVDLVERVDDDPPHPVGQRLADLGGGLVVAVEADPLRREAGALRDRQLATRAHVEVQALVGDPARHGRAEERLARVVDVGTGQPVEGRTEPVAELPCARTEVVFIQDVRSSAVLLGQGEHVDAADGQPAGLVTVDGARPELRQQLHDVGRERQVERRPAVALGVEDTGLVRTHRSALTSARGR